jgi:hypothetical protein
MTPSGIASTDGPLEKEKKRKLFQKEIEKVFLLRIWKYPPILV